LSRRGSPSSTVGRPSTALPPSRRRHSEPVEASLVATRLDSRCHRATPFLLAFSCGLKPSQPFVPSW
jgi:hypothetical protein